MTFSSLLAYETPGINLFGFKITAYALIIVSGILAAFFIISLLFKRRNMSPDFFLTPLLHLLARLFGDHSFVLLYHRRHAYFGMV